MPQRLNALDASFLYMERPNNHMHVGGVAILDPSALPGGRLPFEKLIELIESRIHLVPRFRQKVRFIPFDAGRPVWVDDADFDLRFHVRRTAIPPPGGTRELCEQVERVASRPLDRSKPLWEMYLVEGLEGGYVAAITKIHHAMIDGISAMEIGAVLLDFEPEPKEVKAEPWEPEPEPAPTELLRDALADQVRHPIRSIIEGASVAVRAPAMFLEQARRTLEGVGSFVSGGIAPQGPFNRPVGAARRFAMAEVPVEDAKAIKNALGGKVNDVILAAVAGALHVLLESRGEAKKGATLRAMVPVSTRDESQKMALGNEVSSIFVDLPVGPMKPEERLARIVKKTKDLKSAHQAVGAGALMNLTTWAPPTLHALAARLAGRSRFMNLVVSNVPGPPIPLYLGGARLVAHYPVMPLTERMGLSIAVTSISGTMGYGFTSDWDALPDIDVLASGLLTSFEELRKAAGL